MRWIVAVAVLLLLPAAGALAADGVISIQSQFDVNTTADRLENSLRQKGMKVFARIDHADGAAGVGKSLRPTELIIFGNPKVGTPLMQCRQTIGIDLPQKTLIWQDADGNVWLSYNDPNYLAQRHALSDCGAVVEKVARALAGFAADATR